MTTTMTLTGHDAIRYAEAHGLTLSKRTDPTEDARDGLTLDEAREIAREDPTLIFITPDAYAAVGSDGRRLVAWGVGATEDEALADAREQDEIGDVALECYAITAAQRAAIEAGDVAWPVAVRCECGQATGVACDEEIKGDAVTVEWMPRQHRASHEAAGNRGVYPHNGAVRLRVSRDCGDSLVADDGEWASIVSGT